MSRLRRQACVTVPSLVTGIQLFPRCACCEESGCDPWCTGICVSASVTLCRLFQAESGVLCYLPVELCKETPSCLAPRPHRFPSLPGALQGGFSTPLPVISSFCVHLHYSQQSGYEAASDCALGLHFSNVSEAEHLFLYFLVIFLKF